MPHFCQPEHFQLQRHYIELDKSVDVKPKNKYLVCKVTEIGQLMGDRKQLVSAYRFWMPQQLIDHKTKMPKPISWGIECKDNELLVYFFGPSNWYFQNLDQKLSIYFVPQVNNTWPKLKRLLLPWTLRFAWWDDGGDECTRVHPGVYLIASVFIIWLCWTSWS